MQNLTRRTLALVAAALPLTGRARAQDLDLAAAMGERGIGRADAPITVQEFFSMTCGHCASFHTQTLPRIKTELIDTGRLRLVYRDFPLERVALAAHMVARALPADRYVPFIDTLLRTQSQWAANQRTALDELAKVAALAGMPRPQFDAVLANEPLQRALLEARLKAEQEYQVEGTPTFIASTGKRLGGAASFERFLELANGAWPPPPA